MKNFEQAKAQRGFTLVEVIVVAIIVAALAGVAIPMYTSYVSTSRQNAAANAAGSIAAFMGACSNQNGTTTAPGFTLNSPTTVAPGASLSCDATTPPTTMQLPVGFDLLISTAAGNHYVRARHSASPTADTAHYNY
jgi:prepilin-type N-terminal cleavage/methylation domain-containing protein